MNYQNLSPDFSKPLKTHVEAYLRVFPDESKRLKSLTTFLDNNHDEPSAFDRKNFVGHITASGLVLSPDKQRLLFLRHKTLNRYLQPGGHVDPTDSNILAAAEREVREETPIREMFYIPYHIDFYLPIDIDTHDIPANAAKGEPKHPHYDFRYLFYVNQDVNLTEVVETPEGELVWLSFDEAAESASLRLVVEKIRIALSQEFLPRRFYSKVAARAEFPKRFSSVVVTHILPDALSYLEALSAVSNVQAVIPKPKSIVPKIRATLEKQFSFYDYSREDILKTTELFALLNSFQGDFVLFDIGGYFAPIVADLHAQFPKRLLGIIEDTENGHQKYLAAEKKGPLTVPVISVARSPLKDTEDFLVGQSVLFSADAILRECGLLIQYLRCGVLGYGKIGRSIAHHLLLRGIKPSVFDIKPIRRIHARNQMADTPERDQLLMNSDILFAATGNRSLGLLDFRTVKAGCFIFSVTSSDDEFDTQHLAGEYECEEVAPKVFRYTHAGHYFYLVNQGNAVNFLHKAVLSTFIHLVRSEMVYASSCLTKGEFQPGFHELSEGARSAIAEEWLAIFNTSQTLSIRFEIKDEKV